MLWQAQCVKMYTNWRWHLQHLTIPSPCWQHNTCKVQSVINKSYFPQKWRIFRICCTVFFMYASNPAAISARSADVMKPVFPDLLHTVYISTHADKGQYLQLCRAGFNFLHDLKICIWLKLLVVFHTMGRYCFTQTHFVQIYFNMTWKFTPLFELTW